MILQIVLFAFSSLYSSDKCGQARGASIIAVLAGYGKYTDYYSMHNLLNLLEPYSEAFFMKLAAYIHLCKTSCKISLWSRQIH